VSSLFRAQYVIDIEDIVAVFVIESVVLRSFARLGQDATRIARRLVFEAGVTNSVCGREVYGERLERLS
jgi:hypothetical protein